MVFKTLVIFLPNSYQLKSFLMLNSVFLHQEIFDQEEGYKLFIFKILL